MITFVDNEKAVQFEFGDSRWKCDLATYAVTKVGPAERRRPTGISELGMRMWERGPAPQAASPEARTSPDGEWEAFIKNYNVWVRTKDKKEVPELTAGELIPRVLVRRLTEKAAGWLLRGYHRIPSCRIVARR
jgi:hypothetical protein